jgi:hypothetical protein
VQFSDTQDEITWCLTQDGKYSTRSAYTAQFLGSFADNNGGRLWTVKAENKCKVWAWLILQNKLKTVNRIIKNGGSANPVCQLCYTHNESAAHMLLSCHYSGAVWQELKEWSATPNATLPQTENMVEPNALCWKDRQDCSQEQSNQINLHGMEHMEVKVSPRI